MIKRSVKKAFTLIEILIVVVILGILAAIVIPQFTKASEEAQSGNVVTQLQTIRSQIELFRVRNNGRFPDLSTTRPFYEIVNDPSTGFAPTTLSPDPQHTYLKNAPTNPRTRTNTVSAGTAAPTSAVTGDGSEAGWIYDDATGNIWANGFDESTGRWITPSSGGGGGGGGGGN